MKSPSQDNHLPPQDLSVFAHWFKLISMKSRQFELASFDLSRALRAWVSWPTLALLIIGILPYLIVGNRGNESDNKSIVLVMAFIASLMLAAIIAVVRTGEPAPDFPSILPSIDHRASRTDRNWTHYWDRLATLGIAGTLCTSAMDSVMAINIGSFTIRFAQLCALIFFLSIAGKHLQSRQPITLPYWPVIAALVYLFTASISATRSHDFAKSLGYLAWAGFDLIIVWGAIVTYVTTTKHLQQALCWWGCGMAIDVAMGGVQWFSWFLGYTPPLGYSDGSGFVRLNGFSYESSYYALYLVPGALFFLTSFALLGRSAWRSAVLSCGLVLAVILSTSRSGWMGLTLGVAALSLVIWKINGNRAFFRLALPVTSALALFGLTMCVTPVSKERITRLAEMAFDTQEKSSSAPRLQSMVEASTLFSSHPILGVGFGNYGKYVLEHSDSSWNGLRSSHEIVPTNLYLEIAAETGVLGFISAIFMIAVMFVPLAFAKKRNQPEDNLSPESQLRAYRLGLFVACLIVFGVLFQFSQTLWRLDIWILLALSCAVSRISPEYPEPKTRV